MLILNIIQSKIIIKSFSVINELNADIVIGSRFLAPKYVRVHYFWHAVGNKFITFLFNILNNTTFTDIYSCYLAIRINLIDIEKLKHLGWSQQAEILGSVVKKEMYFMRSQFLILEEPMMKVKK